MGKLKTQDQIYYNLAKTSEAKRLDVIEYYKKCVRLAKYNSEPLGDFKKMLAILRNLKKQYA